MALKTEMPRLDDARVDGADRHLVDFLALDAVKIGDADQCIRHTPCAGCSEADRLEPGVSFGLNAELLGDFPFEEMDLGAIGCE